MSAQCLSYIVSKLFLQNIQNSLDNSLQVFLIRIVMYKRSDSEFIGNKLKC